MKIAIIGPAWPLRGGIADFNEALATALQSEGHEVRLFSFSLQYPKILFPGKSQFDDGAAPDDLKIVPCINSVSPYSWLTTASKIKAWKPDLVVVRFWLPFMGPSLGSICRMIRKKVKVIAITDNVIPHEKRPGDGVFTRYFIKSCDAFIAMSRSVLEDLGRFDTQKPRVYLPHPIYNIFGDAVPRAEALLKLKLDPDKKYLLFFGIIRKYKGLDILLEAFKQCEYKKWGLCLLVAGEFYGEEEEYRNYIRENDLQDFVLLHSYFIPSDQVKYYFSAANLVTQTYRTATQSGVTQIAYHFGKPMLVTDVGGLAETVPDGKVGYVTSVQSSVIAEKINDYFGNNREEIMTHAVLEERNRFDWSFFIKGLIELSLKVKERNLH